MIGYLCAYLRHYYPYEFITAYLNNADNADDIKCGTNLALRYKIHILPPRWKISTANYSIEDVNGERCITTGLGSVKYLNKQVAEELYDLAHNTNETFAETLCDINASTGANSRQLDVLINIDFFQCFGNQVKLTKIRDLCDKFKYGQCSGISRETAAGTYYEPILKKYASDTTKAGTQASRYSFTIPGIDKVKSEIRTLNKQIKVETDQNLLIELQNKADEKAKTASEMTFNYIKGFLAECNQQIDMLNISDVPVKTKIANQLDLLGYIDLTTGLPEDRRKVIIMNVFPLGVENVWGYAVITRSLGTGKMARMTIRKNVYESQPVQKLDIVYADEVEKNRKGYWYMNKYHHVME